jgi:ATP-dependent Lon protease
MAPTSPDASVIRNYVDWLIDLPWSNETVDNKDLRRARAILDEDHYGLEKIKDRIIEFLAVMQLTGKLNGPILCFVGPPGVGKTSIVKSIARALDRKYLRVSLGGVRDEAEIRGHRRTYVGAIPGKIIYMMKQSGCVNPVMLLDEIDKMGKDNRGDPASAMLEVLDPEQNNTFTDHFLEVPYDLSKVLFVCTANATDDIPEPLLDRMEVIELSGYTEFEKIAIADKFLLRKNLEKHGIPAEKVSIDNGTYAKIIERYTRESGVRSLEREIAHICRKVALMLVENPDSEIVINADNLIDYLGVERYKDANTEHEDTVGSATGLAWTRVGGTTLNVDATLFSGKGEILLTGKLGEVMKESARTAISLVRSMSEKYGIDRDRFEKTDIHIHVPEGAIPKDGPSAGVTMATVMMSAFTGRAVSADVAMTGEITLRGKVLPIGGLKEKALAAYRVGVRKLIVPKDNQNDIEDIPKEIASEMQFVLADNIETVFDNALV